MCAKPSGLRWKLLFQANLFVCIFVTIRKAVLTPKILLEQFMHIRRDRESVSYILSNMDDNHKKKTDSIYLPHSVAFGSGQSEAVAMNPWRRFNTRFLCNSPLQQGTIVPVWFNGVVFVSLVPISVPKVNGRKKRKKNRNDQKKLIYRH